MASPPAFISRISHATPRPQAAAIPHWSSARRRRTLPFPATVSVPKPSSLFLRVRRVRAHLLRFPFLVCIHQGLVCFHDTGEPPQTSTPARNRRHTAAPASSPQPSSHPSSPSASPGTSGTSPSYFSDTPAITGHGAAVVLGHRCSTPHGIDPRTPSRRMDKQGPGLDALAKRYAVSFNLYTYRYLSRNVAKAEWLA